MRYADLEQVLRALVPDAPPFFCGPEVPDVPFRFVMLTPTGGPGLSTEGLLDSHSWQFRSAGEQNDRDDAEAIATALDRAVRNLETTTVAGVRIVSFQRSGSAPTPLLVDDAERHHYVASYVATVHSG